MSHDSFPNINPPEINFQPRYAQVKATELARAQQANMSVLVIRNRFSVLNAFMKHCRRADKDVVGHEFGIDFDQNLARWCDAMRKEGKAPRTLEDRCNLILKWRDVVQSQAKIDSLPETFPEALSDAMARRGLCAASLGKIAGIGSGAIADWVSASSRPMRHVSSQILKLEHALQLPVGTLARRLGFVVERYQVSKAAREQVDVLTTYGKRLRAQYHSSVRLNYLKAPHPNVRAEWAQLTAHKINDFRPHASKRDTWRVKPVSKSGNKENWASVHQGAYVPAAGAAWVSLGRFLSWCCLSSEQGGGGVSEERITTLAWVLKHDMMQRCLQWIKMRSGGILHRGQAQILKCACSLLRPETGWLWLHHELVYSFHPRDLPIDIDPDGTSSSKVKELWQVECARVWQLFKTQAESVMASPNLAYGRDPKEPIADVLNQKRPLTAIMDMLATLKRNPPPLNAFKHRAVWLRDVLLLSWLSANPLRAQHFSTMTYRNDGTGNIYKDGSVWHYRAFSWEFKNVPGDYDVTLPSFVGDALEDYLQMGRPHLYQRPEPAVAPFGLRRPLELVKQENHKQLNCWRCCIEFHRHESSDIWVRSHALKFGVRTGAQCGFIRPNEFVNSDSVGHQHNQHFGDFKVFRGPAVNVIVRPSDLCRRPSPLRQSFICHSERASKVRKRVSTSGRTGEQCHQQRLLFARPC